MTRADRCPGSYAAAGDLPRPWPLHADCPDCGRLLRLVGGDVHAGWGRTRLPAHKPVRP